MRFCSGVVRITLVAIVGVGCLGGLTGRGLAVDLLAMAADVEDESPVYGPDAWKEWRDEQKKSQESYEEKLESRGLTGRYETVYLYDNTRHILLDEKDFDLVEERLAAKFEACSEDPLLANRYSGLINSMGTFYYSDDPEVMLGTLDQWVKAKPESHFARTVRGLFYTDYAWYFRGTGFSNTVTERGWEQFHRYLDKAKDDLEEAYRMNPADPEASAGLITVAGGLSLDHSIMRRYYDQALKAYPLHYGARDRMMNFLKPKWGGTWKEVLEIVEEADTHRDEYPLLALLARSAYRDLYRDDLISKKEWNEFQEKYQWPNACIEQLEKNPNDVHLMVAVTYYAYYGGDRTLAIEYFDKVGDRFASGGMWDDVFAHNETHANSYASVATRSDLIGTEKGLALGLKAVEIAPYHYFPNFAYGRVLEEQKRSDEAREYFVTAHEIKPEYPMTLHFLAQIDYDAERYKESIEWAEKALELETLPDYNRKYLERTVRFAKRKSK